MQGVWDTVIGSADIKVVRLNMEYLWGSSWWDSVLFRKDIFFNSNQSIFFETRKNEPGQAEKYSEGNSQNSYNPDKCKQLVVKHCVEEIHDHEKHKTYNSEIVRQKEGI